VLGFDSEVRGNSGQVYHWLLEHGDDALKPVWMTNSKELYERLSTSGYPVAYQQSLRGQLCLLQADIACYDGVSANTFHDRVTTIKVRHEVPVKYGPEAAKNAATPTDASKHDYLVSTSAFLSARQLEYYQARKGGTGVDEFQFVELGFPRNDLLFDPPSDIQRQWNVFVGDTEFETVLLYAPTRRRHRQYDVENTDLFPFADFSIDALHEFLEAHDMLLLVRLHPGDAKQLDNEEQMLETSHQQESLSTFLDELCRSDRVRRASSDDFSDTNELVPFVDTLITDYSTVYHTYLLLDRPIVFIPYDYETAAETFGFKYDYFEHLPGPTIDSFESLIENLKRLENGADPHRDERRALREKIHEYPDGNASQRVVDFIRTLSSNPKQDT